MSCAKKLARPGDPVRFVLAGGVLLKQPGFARTVAKQLKERWPDCEVAPLKRESAWGAVALARRLAARSLPLAPTGGEGRSEGLPWLVGADVRRL